MSQPPDLQLHEKYRRLRRKHGTAVREKAHSLPVLIAGIRQNTFMFPRGFMAGLGRGADCAEHSPRRGVAESGWPAWPGGGGLGPWQVQQVTGQSCWGLSEGEPGHEPAFDGQVSAGWGLGQDTQSQAWRWATR